MKEGLLEEAKELLPFRHKQALQTVGYKELLEYLDGHISLEKAIEQIKINSRHYAKRQLTWFRRDSEIKWFDAFKSDHLEVNVSSFLQHV
jgi:tRNA dimethylallyltransferase